MFNETNGQCFMLWGDFVIMFIYPFKIEQFNFCEEFLRIALLNTGCFFCFFCGSSDRNFREH